MFKYILVLLILFVLEVIYLKIATLKNINDVPNHRSAHTKPILRGGGIIIIFGIILYMLFYKTEPLFYYFLASSLLVALVSFIDDLVLLSSKLRIVIHLFAFSLLFYGLGLFSFTQLSSILFLIIIYIFSIGYLNVYNFMDGINGITFLNALISYITLLYLNELYEAFTDSNLLIILIMATIIFGLFNFRKRAICFAGDIGSITIGFSLIYFALVYYLETNNILIVLMFSVYLLDGGWTIFERLLRRENIFEAHKRHLYQILANDFKVSHLKISSIYFIIQLMINGILIFSINNKMKNMLILGLILISLSIIYLVTKKKFLKTLRLRE